MFHPLATRWDELHGGSRSPHLETCKHCGGTHYYAAPPPKNRPCTWCGKLIPQGYIHDRCDEIRTQYIEDICLRSYSNIKPPWKVN